MKDADEEEEEEDEVSSELDPEGSLIFTHIIRSLIQAWWCKEFSDSEEDAEEDISASALANSDHNSQLMVGYKGDRSYVVRGDKIGVFDHSADHEAKYISTMAKISTLKGKSFKPKNVSW